MNLSDSELSVELRWNIENSNIRSNVEYSNMTIYSNINGRSLSFEYGHGSHGDVISVFDIQVRQTRTLCRKRPQTLICQPITLRHTEQTELPNSVYEKKQCRV